MTIKNKQEHEAQGLMEELHNILSERLVLSRSWCQVKVDRRKTFLEVKWYDSVTYDDPEGKFSFKLDRVSPLSLETLSNAVKRQREKLSQDRRDATRREDVG